jgi:hypothetical protein
MPLKFSVSRTRIDLIGCVASVVDAIACLAFLVLQADLTNSARALVECVVDPVTCMVVYWALYWRLRDTRPILAEAAFYALFLGTFFIACENGLEDLGNLNAFSLNSVYTNELHTLLELLVAFTLPVGLAVYAWLITSSPPLRRWLGFLIGGQVVCLYMSLASFRIPQVWEFVDSQVLTIYAIILSLAKAVWFLSPVAGSKIVPVDREKRGP